jgi:hypothetical protein
MASKSSLTEVDIAELNGKVTNLRDLCNSTAISNCVGPCVKQLKRANFIAL